MAMMIMIIIMFVVLRSSFVCGRAECPREAPAVMLNHANNVLPPCPPPCHKIVHGMFSLICARHETSFKDFQWFSLVIGGFDRNCSSLFVDIHWSHVIFMNASMCYTNVHWPSPISKHCRWFSLGFIRFHLSCFRIKIRKLITRLWILRKTI